jgi:hypothetical protein
LYSLIDTGGSAIIGYDLQIDGGTINSAFIPVATYNGLLLTATIDDIRNGLTAGLIYTFKFRANNLIGYSEYSNVLRVGLGD